MAYHRRNKHRYYLKEERKTELTFSTTPLNLLGPDDIDRQNETALVEVLGAANRLKERDDQASKRLCILQELNIICLEWVREAAEQCNETVEVVMAARVRLYAFGSYKLSVHSHGDDVDLLLVGPHFVTRDMFFDGLGQRLANYPAVREFRDIRGAFVPVMSFNFDGIEIDMVYAQLQIKYIDDAWDIQDDWNLKHLEYSTVLSLNGVRLAEKILALVPNQNVFRLSLRAIRHWAKRRAIYSNKLGYLGGVSWGILTARVCQLYPNANASQIVQNFFLFYHIWNFGSPLKAITLCELVRHDDIASINERVWDPNQGATKNELMHIITPAFPAMNSTHNVSMSTFEVIKREIARGFHVLTRAEREVDKSKWQSLFEKSSFFMDHKQYLFVKACAPSQHLPEWSGLVESKIRGLVGGLEYHSDVQVTTYCRSISILLKQADIHQHTNPKIVQKLKLKVEKMQKLQRLMALKKQLQEQQQQQKNLAQAQNDLAAAANEGEKSKSASVQAISNPTASTKNSPSLTPKVFATSRAASASASVSPPRASSTSAAASDESKSASSLHSKNQHSLHGNAHAFAVGDNEVSCCANLDSKTLKQKAEKSDYHCKAFVIGIKHCPKATKFSLNADGSETVVIKSADFTRNIWSFLKTFSNHIYSDSHVIVEMVPCNKIPHFLFPEFENARPSAKLIAEHQSKIEQIYKLWKSKDCLATMDPEKKKALNNVGKPSTDAAADEANGASSSSSPPTDSVTARNDGGQPDQGFDSQDMLMNDDNCMPCMPGLLAMPTPHALTVAVDADLEENEKDTNASTDPVEEAVEAGATQTTETGQTADTTTPMVIAEPPAKRRRIVVIEDRNRYRTRSMQNKPAPTEAPAPVVDSMNEAEAESQVVITEEEDEKVDDWTVNAYSDKVDWTTKKDDSPTWDYAVKLQRMAHQFGSWSTISYQVTALATHVYNTCHDQTWKQQLKNIIEDSRFKWNGYKFSQGLDQRTVYALACEIAHKYVLYKATSKRNGNAD